MNSLEIGKQMIMPESVRALRSVVMFWNPQNHPDTDPMIGLEAKRERISRLKETILEKITEAQSIHAVRRAAAKAYWEILPDKAYQSSLQQAVIQKKYELRRKRT
jgi:hypothetical protein